MDLPKRILIEEDGPREGFQMEKTPISTEDKIRLIDALSETGLQAIQVTSFVNPQKVPGMADAEEVARRIRRAPGVRYTAAWLNLRGLQRALATTLHIRPRMHTSASEALERTNTGKDGNASLDEMRRMADYCRAQGLKIDTAIVMSAFGCNVEGPIAPSRVVQCVQSMMDMLAEYDMTLNYLRLGDTVGWATPLGVERVVGAVRERWPDLELGLHLHDTRGTGIANAYAGLRMGIARFDSSLGGLGGCPFAKGASGNVCTEDLVFMCEEMGVETGVDLDKLIECACMAEEIVGHPLPGKVKLGGSLSRFKKPAAVPA